MQAKSNLEREDTSVGDEDLGKTSLILEEMKKSAMEEGLERESREER